MNLEQYLQSKDLSQAVIKRYLAEIQWFERFLNQRGRSLENAAKKDVLDYLRNQHRPVSKYQKVVKKQLTNQTKRGILGILNHFYSHLVKEGAAAQNITQFIKIRGAKRKYLRPLFTPEELDGLCDLLYNHHQEQNPHSEPTLQQQKDYVLLTLAAYQGLNVHEIRRLEKNDFDLRKATVKIHATRRTNARTLPIEAAQMGALMAYFAERETADLVTSNGCMQFLNEQLRTLHPKYENFLQIRASVITNWIKAEGLRKAQYMAGHRYISSTENYLHNDFESLQSDMDNFHPLG